MENTESINEEIKQNVNAETSEDENIKTDENCMERPASEENEDEKEKVSAERKENVAGEASDSDLGEESDLKENKDPKDTKIDELNDKYRRLFAEFDNFRKRTDLEKAGMFGDGERTILLKILPLLDNFERALDNIPEESANDSFTEGIKMIYKQFTDIMTEVGVKKIESVGQPFNSDFHNAVMHIEDEELPENTVAEEFQKGYMFKDKVLRYAMVKVAN